MYGTHVRCEGVISHVHCVVNSSRIKLWGDHLRYLFCYRDVISHFNFESHVYTLFEFHPTLLTILPTMQVSVPMCFMSFILLLSTIFTLAILLIQLFSPTSRYREYIWLQAGHGVDQWNVILIVTTGVQLVLATFASFLSITKLHKDVRKLVFTYNCWTEDKASSADVDFIVTSCVYADVHCAMTMFEHNQNCRWVKSCFFIVILAC